MKTVIFFRHGKSDWEAEYEHDLERPLTKRGRKSARAMGRFLAETDQLPDSVVTSTAVRAQKTVRAAAKAGEWAAPVRETSALYDAEPAAVLRVIQTEPDDAASLLLVGHEPVWSETISLLIGGGALRVPTAAMARVDFDAERWDEVHFGTGRLVWLVTPALVG